MGDKHGEDREESHLQVKKFEALSRIFREFILMKFRRAVFEERIYFVYDIYIYIY